MGRILNSKISDGSCVGYWDFRSGTVLDLSGTGNSGTIVGSPQFTNIGLMMDGDADDIGVEDIDLDSAMSFVALIQPSSFTNSGGGNYPRIIGKTSAYDIYFNNGTGIVTFFTTGVSDTNTNSVTAINIGELTVVGGSYSATSGNRKIYVNGIKDVEEGSLTGNISTNANITRLGNNNNGDRNFQGIFSAAILFNEELTETEMAQITSELRGMKFPTKSIAKTKVNKLQKFDTLTSQWVMKPQGNTIVDETGAGNDATRIGAVTFVDTPIGPGAHLVDSINRFDTGSDWVDTNAITFGCWVILDGYGPSNAGRLFENGKTLLRWDGGNTRMVFSSDGSTSVNSATGSVPLNRLTFVSVTRTAGGVTNFYVDGVLSGSADQDSGTPVSGTNNIIFGNRNAGDRATEGVIIEPFAIVGTVETADQILERYQKGANQVQFTTDWGAYATEQNVTDGFIGNTPWQRNTGTWKISTDTINDNNVKVLECVTAGTAYTQISQLFMDNNDAAFGTWEFWAYKALDSNLLNVQFLCDAIGNESAAGQDGYTLSLETNESIRFRESVNGTPSNKFLTGASYFSIATWYGYKITRSNLGVFTVYIKGGAFGDNWTIVDVSGGAGTNPVTDLTTTSAEYIVFDLDAGDKIAIANTGGNYSFVKRVGVI